MDYPPSPTPNDPLSQPEKGLSGLQLAGLLIITFLLGLGAGYFIFATPLQAKVAALETQSQNAQATVVSQANTATQSAATEAARGQDQIEVPENVQRYAVPVDDDDSLGPEDAPITIIEFSDYQCPFCRKWQLESWPLLQEKYGDKIRLVYRDFPLSNHPEAMPAAVAAECAGAQGKYYEYHNLLFQGGELSAAVYEQYAQQTGLDVAQWKTCLADGKVQAEVQADFDYAAQLGVQSTPTFFINGLALVGAQPASVFQQIIDLELAGKIPRN